MTKITIFHLHLLIIVTITFLPNITSVPRFISDAAEQSRYTLDDDSYGAQDQHREVDDHHFGYNRYDGPHIWAKFISKCAGARQSPINLDTTTTVPVHYPHLFWFDYNLKPKRMMVFNNGHTFGIKGEWDSQEQIPYFWHSSDNNEVTNYAFHNIHFHWGQTDDEGSEHTLNEQRFPLEMHAVHYKRELPDIISALNVPGGLSVVGVLFTISEHNNTALDPIISSIPRVVEPDTAVDIDPVQLSQILPTFSKFFLSYSGSLTTPPCSESVAWIVRTELASISKSQLEEFRKIIGYAGKIEKNYRNLQPLNGRIVYHVR